MTQHADRKARIRAYQAAHPGLSFTAAARHVDGSDITVRLAALPSGPQNALAVLLATLIHNDEAVRAADWLARELAPDPEAERLEQATQAAYTAMMNAPARLAARKRRELEQAYDAAQDAQGWHHYTPNPYEAEQFLLHAVATALRATTAGHGARFAGAAADVLDTLQLLNTADAIRGYRDKLGVIPAIPAIAAEGPAARDAQASLRALASAADIPWRGDEEWMACNQLLEHARDLARSASIA